MEWSGAAVSACNSCSEEDSGDEVGELDEWWTCIVALSDRFMGRIAGAAVSLTDGDNDDVDTIKPDARLAADG